MKPKNIKKQQTLFRILLSIQEKPKTIAELTREFNINRSTLRYYLSLLREEREVIFERKENEAGRPTYIKFNIEKANEDFKKRKLEIDEYTSKMEKDELVLFLKKLFIGKKFLTLKDIIQSCKEKNIIIEEPQISKVLSALNFVMIYYKNIEQGWMRK